MNVAQLIDLLNEYDPNAEVRIMSQPNWPFECAVAGVTSREEMAALESEDGDGEPTDTEEGAGTVFLCEGAQLQYGSKLAWQAIGPVR